MWKRYAAYLLALTLAVPSSMAEEWYTLSRIREQTQNGWHETVKGKKGDVVVDVTVEIPEISEAAVVVIRGNDPVAEEKLAGMKVTENQWGSLRVQSPAYDQTESADGQSIRFYPEGDELPDRQASASPLTCREALKAISAKVESLTGMRYGRDYGLDKIVIGNDYTFLGHWQVDGIPMPCAMMMYAFVSLSYTDESRWRIFVNPYSQESVLYPDVPFCSFEEVKQTVRSALQKGKLKNVAKIQLAYTPCGDKAQLADGRLTMVPTWHIYEKYDPNLAQVTGPKLVLSVQDAKSYTRGRKSWFVELMNGIRTWDDALTASAR